MRQLFTSKNPFIIIILFIGTLLMKFPAILNCEAPGVVPGFSLYNVILEFIPLGGLGYCIVTLFIHFLLAIYLNAIAEKHQLYRKQNYVVAFVYLMFSAMYPPFNYFSEAVCIQVIIVLAIDAMLHLYKTTQPTKTIFNTGFILGLGVLFSFPFVLLLLLLLAALLILRAFNWKELLVGIIGFITPVYFLICILYIYDATGLLKEWIVFNPDFYPIETRKLYWIGSLSGVTVLLLTGFIVIRMFSSKAHTYLVRSWMMIVVLLLISFVALWLSPQTRVYHLQLLIPSLSLIITNSYLVDNPKRLSSFVFYFSIALVIFSLITYQ